ncbi:bile acid:sodium symporter family protein [Heliobacterium mobile]|nr:bile acid:sodium symporter family protein [Heliobacterium mobile]
MTSDWVIRANRFLEKGMFLLIPGAIVFGFFYWTSLHNEKAWVYWMFAYMTFIGALNCSWAQFRTLFREPALFLTSLLLLHGFIPAVAFLMGLLFFPKDPQTVIGMVIGSTIPVAVTASVWTNISRGNNSFSLALVVLDTLLSPIILPAFSYVVLHTSGSIPVEKLVMDMLIMVVIPCILGLIFHPYRFWDPKGPVQAGLSLLSKLALFLVVAINVAIMHDYLVQGWSQAGLILLALSATIVVAYLMGFVAGKVLRRSNEDVIALTYSSGMRNIALGVVFSTGYFDFRVSVPIVFMSLLQQPIATVVNQLLQRRTKVERGRLEQSRSS